MARNEKLTLCSAPQVSDEYGDLRLHAHTIYRDQLKGYGRTLSG